MKHPQADVVETVVFQNLEDVLFHSVIAVLNATVLHGLYPGYVGTDDKPLGNLD
jgi:hypothetical protein